MTATAPTPRVEPAEFLREARAAAPGWSERFGGPEGVAVLAARLQEALKEQARDLAAVRAAAVQELLVTRSLTDVARSLGISKQAASKVARAPRARDLEW